MMPTILLTLSEQYAPGLKVLCIGESDKVAQSKIDRCHLEAMRHRENLKQPGTFRVRASLPLTVKQVHLLSELRKRRYLS